MPQRKHSVTFYSAGTMFAETTTKPIDDWNPQVAAKMAETITERYGATPYAFCFMTHITADSIPDGEGGELEVDSKLMKTSGMHFIGGTIRTLEEIKARGHADEHILRANMKGNGYDRIIERPCGHTQPFRDGDVVI